MIRDANVVAAVGAFGILVAAGLSCWWILGRTPPRDDGGEPRYMMTPPRIIPPGLETDIFCHYRGTRRDPLVGSRHLLGAHDT